MSDPDQARRIEQLEAENARLRSLLDRQGMPSALHHQVRNALGLMRAILRRSAEAKSTVEEYAAHLEGRIDALLRIQTALLASPDGSVDVAALVADELLAQTSREIERARIDGPEVRLDGRQAELLGLVLHELATNAIKFGAMASSEGRLDVAWRVSAPPRRLELTWIESGLPRTGTQAIVPGFGMEAIKVMLPYQIRAETTLQFLPDGLRCTIAVPLLAAGDPPRPVSEAQTPAWR